MVDKAGHVLSYRDLDQSLRQPRPEMPHHQPTSSTSKKFTFLNFNVNKRQHTRDLQQSRSKGQEHLDQSQRDRCRWKFDQQYVFGADVSANRREGLWSGEPMLMCLQLHCCQARWRSGNNFVRIRSDNGNDRADIVQRGLVGEIIQRFERRG
jgi:hypothetical protein